MIYSLGAFEQPIVKKSLRHPPESKALLRGETVPLRPTETLGRQCAGIVFLQLAAVG